MYGTTSPTARIIESGYQEVKIGVTSSLLLLSHQISYNSLLPISTTLCSAGLKILISRRKKKSSIRDTIMLPDH